MPETRPKAMVSSSSAVHAERMLIAADLAKVFLTVVRAPEESRGGTNTDSYLDDAASTSFLVVLLTQDSRPAVVEEIRVALGNGAHIAGFSLQYLPFRAPGGPWNQTAEELLLHDNNLFVRSVNSIVELQEEVARALAHFLATTVSRFQASNSSQNYALARRWLQAPNIRRVALVQRSSILALGARRGNVDEAACMASVNTILTQARTRTDLEFVHVFDLEETVQEASANPAIYGGQNHQRTFLKSYVRNRPAKRPIHIAALEGTDTLASVLLVNDRVALGTPLGAGGIFLSVVEDKQTADSAMEMLKENRRGNYLAADIDRIDALFVRQAP